MKPIVSVAWGRVRVPTLLQKRPQRKGQCGDRPVVSHLEPEHHSQPLTPRRNSGSRRSQTGGQKDHPRNQRAGNGRGAGGNATRRGERFWTFVSIVLLLLVLLGVGIMARLLGLAEGTETIFASLAGIGILVNAWIDDARSGRRL